MPSRSWSPEQAHAVLEERARALAQPIAALTVGDVLGLISFTLGGEVYALDSRFVLEVFRPMDVAPLPGAEPPLFGVTAWRGELLPVIDLRSLLGLPATAPSDRPMLFILGRAQAVLGMSIDAPGEVLAIAEDAIRPPDGIAASEYVRGVAPAATLVLDAEKILRVAGPESL